MAEELFDQRGAAVEAGFFCKHTESAGRDDEMNVGNTVIEFEGAKHLDGKGGAAGAGDGEGQREWHGVRRGDLR